MKRFERNGYGSFLAVLAALLLSTSTRVEAQTVDLAALEAKIELSRESLEKVEHGITAMGSPFSMARLRQESVRPPQA